MRPDYTLQVPKKFLVPKLASRALEFTRRSRHDKKLAIKSTFRWAFRKVVANRTGWNYQQWSRIVQIREWENYLQSLPLAQLQVLEISPGDSNWQRFGFGDYRSVQFPE